MPYQALGDAPDADERVRAALTHPCLGWRNIPTGALAAALYYRKYFLEGRMAARIAGDRVAAIPTRISFRSRKWARVIFGRKKGGDEIRLAQFLISELPRCRGGNSCLRAVSSRRS